MGKKPIIWACAALAVVLLLPVLLSSFTGVARYEYEHVPMELTSVAYKVPELMMTDQEIALADTILHFPVIRDARESGQDRELAWEQAATEELERIRPDWAEHAGVEIVGQSVILDFRGGTNRLILEYCDRDGGSADLIRKTWNNDSGSFDATIYTAEYIPILQEHRYEKAIPKRQYFPFLDIP